ncbi:phage terminase small subunit [Chromobacterium sp. IIBBL 290-4]|uniref:phage terminase small subunit n=1 Tax=Chromobacterium sp. IIBBL 290-4 TaxID=2953890 RepID=UPI0020B66430|nr:phage terminase small subunit [Chromobacterium sp. IIBBL 290-4]UTH73356.1 phage terminase small subunit [Chromobacterium sp. IIBBL 290-4]
MSHARAHFQRASAAKASALAVEDGPVNCTAYEMMLVKLAEDKRRLKQVQSTEGKAEVKRQILPDYAPWVEGALQGGKGQPDDVLMTVLMWRIDAGDYSGALDIAEYALPHGLPLPDQFSRTTATAVAEEIADAAKRARDGKQPFELQTLTYTAELTDKHDMPDQVRAKLLKETGLAMAEAEPSAALEHLRRAQQLHGAVGVKKDIERIERAIKNSAPPPTGSQA